MTYPNTFTLIDATVEPASKTSCIGRPTPEVQSKVSVQTIEKQLKLVTLGKLEGIVSNGQIQNGTLTDTTENVGFGGIAINERHQLPEGHGKLAVSEYYPWADPEFERDPYPWYERALAEVPVIQDTDGTYIVAKYADVMEFGPMECMSVEAGWEAAGPWSVASASIIGRDAPAHTRLRRVTTKWFAPRAVREWTQTTAKTTNEILDQMAESRIDGWSDLSGPPTHRTIEKVLQVGEVNPHEIMHEIGETMPMMSSQRKDGTLERAADGFNRLGDRIDEYLKERASAPGDGLLDALIQAERDGKMNHDEMRSTALLLYGLGNMDVGYLVATGLRIFSELPEVYKAFREQEESRDAIINEMVRYDPPELSFYRTTKEDVTIRGVEIPAGSMIRYMMGAANRDPEVFDNPHIFDYTRPPEQSRNLSFGLGPHTCAGQGYARAQTRTIFETIASRFKYLEPAGPFEMDNTDFSRHYVTLPLKLYN